MRSPFSRCKAAAIMILQCIFIRRIQRHMKTTVNQASRPFGRIFAKRRAFCRTGNYLRQIAAGDAERIRTANFSFADLCRSNGRSILSYTPAIPCLLQYRKRKTRGFASTCDYQNLWNSRQSFNLCFSVLSI